MTLREKRVLFTSLIARLVEHVATTNRYECALNEVLRDPRVAALNAKSGKGIKKSNHIVGLAADVMLYDMMKPKGKEYCETTLEHQWLGAWWVRQHPLCRWGGDWGDGNHYSFEHEGVR